MRAKINAKIPLTVGIEDVKAILAETLNDQYGLCLKPERIEFTYEGEHDMEELSGIQVDMTVADLKGLSGKALVSLGVTSRPSAPDNLKGGRGN